MAKKLKRNERRILLSGLIEMGRAYVVGILSIMAVAMTTRHRRMTMWSNNLGSVHQYTPMIEHVTCMVAIDTCNGQ